MLQAPLEQFQVLQLIPISVLSFDFSVTNFLLINLLALLSLISFIYYSVFYSNYLLEVPLFFFFYPEFRSKSFGIYTHKYHNFY